MRLLQSLTRGLEALDFLVESQSPVRLTDIASKLGVEKSNAVHVLKTLVAGGYAEQDRSRRYGATKKVSQPYRDGRVLEEIVDCKERCRPVLERLVRETGECAHLAVLVRERVWYIDKVDSSLPLKVDHPIGSLSPLHCSALGKAFLAFGLAEQTGTLTAFTPKTLTNLAALSSEISRTRVQGYAVDDEEFAPGIRCVARPVLDGTGRMIAAIGISGPTVRIDDERLSELGAIIMSFEIPSTNV